jgi:ribose transport system permease protein
MKLSLPWDDQPPAVRRAIRLVGSIGPVYVALVVLALIAQYTEPAVLTERSIRNIIIGSTALGIVTIGQTLTMLIAGIDLSIGSVMSLVTVIAAVEMKAHPDRVNLIVLLCLGAGVGVGIVNGIGTAYLNINPLIFTLASGTAIQGWALHILYSPGGRVTRDFRELARGMLTDTVPNAALYLLVLYVIGTFILRFTAFGQSIYAVGGNEVSARLSGLRTRRIKLTVYVLSGFMAALGGLFLVGRIGSGDPLAGEPFTLDSITAGVLGGTSLFGGIGGLWGGLAGVFIFGLLNTLLNLNKVSSFYQWIIKGAILIGALAVNFLRRKNTTS